MRAALFLYLARWRSDAVYRALSLPGEPFVQKGGCWCRGRLAPGRVPIRDEAYFLNISGIFLAAFFDEGGSARFATAR